MMGQVATETNEVVVNSFVEVRGDTLVVNVKKRYKTSMFVPTIKIPLNHVLGAKADPEIERKLWRAWVLGKGIASVPEPGTRFYNPRHGLSQKAVVIRLKDELCERLVVEVQDPAEVVAQINQAVGTPLA